MDVKTCFAAAAMQQSYGKWLSEPLLQADEHHVGGMSPADGDVTLFLYVVVDHFAMSFVVVGCKITKKKMISEIISLNLHITSTQCYL